MIRLLLSSRAPGGCFGKNPNPPDPAFVRRRDMSPGRVTKAEAALFAKEPTSPLIRSRVEGGRTPPPPLPDG